MQTWRSQDSFKWVWSSNLNQKGVFDHPMYLFISFYCVYGVDWHFVCISDELYGGPEQCQKDDPFCFVSMYIPYYLFSVLYIKHLLFQNFEKSVLDASSFKVCLMFGSGLQIISLLYRWGFSMLWYGIFFNKWKNWQYLVK